MRVPTLLIATAALVAPALAHEGHFHLTVDTVNGQPGDAIVIRAGYYGDEADISIDADGYVVDDGEILVSHIEDVLGQDGPFHGWFAGNPVNLTSDYYFGTGRLDGGDFYYEIVAVDIVDAPESADVAWGDVDQGGFRAEALASADSRPARSFRVGIGGHDHEQATAVSAEGEFDVTIIAWDANGRYTDSSPVILRLHAGPACPADFNDDGFLDLFDFLAFVNAFNNQDPRADLDGNGVFDLFDFLAFQNLFVAGC